MMKHIYYHILSGEVQIDKVSGDIYIESGYMANFQCVLTLECKDACKLY